MPGYIFRGWGCQIVIYLFFYSSAAASVKIWRQQPEVKLTHSSGDGSCIFGCRSSLLLLITWTRAEEGWIIGAAIIVIFHVLGLPGIFGAPPTQTWLLLKAFPPPETSLQTCWKLRDGWTMARAITDSFLYLIARTPFLTLRFDDSAGLSYPLLLPRSNYPISAVRDNRKPRHSHGPWPLNITDVRDWEHCPPCKRPRRYTNQTLISFNPTWSPYQLTWLHSSMSTAHFTLRI